MAQHQIELGVFGVQLDSLVQGALRLRKLLKPKVGTTELQQRCCSGSVGTQCTGLLACRDRAFVILLPLFDLRQSLPSEWVLRVVAAEGLSEICSPQVITASEIMLETLALFGRNTVGGMRWHG
ncbi:hypothetical protein [Halochromatium glycolicum]|uniref:hypothetical protein n=1 Tax=Halochromatium glycolicum TaxID=85075 RepID=UPI001F5BAEDF|nr:hypothetical protein [Halochromatium glycolicum]